MKKLLSNIRALFYKDLVVTKVIYNYRAKTIKQIMSILEGEVDTILRSSLGYELKSFSKPIYKKDGTMTYKIKFSKIRL
jgi:hypothetical protein